MNQKNKSAESESAKPAETSHHSIGIIGWNSPKFSQSHHPFVESLKKQVIQHGLTPVFFGISCASDLLSLTSKSEDQPVFPFHLAGSENGAHHTNTPANYWLPSRDIVADQIEILIQEERLDGLVMIPWSVSSLVGMLMAMARCGVPGLVLPYYKSWTAFSNVGKNQTPEEMEFLSYNRCSMLVLLEVLGLTKIGTLDAVFSSLKKGKPARAEKNASKLPGAETAEPKSEDFSDLVDWGSKRVAELSKQKISPRRFFSQASLTNAACVDMALGGSAETVLHLNALAYEAGLPLVPTFFNDISRRTPQIVPMNRQGEFNIDEIQKNGGLLALLGALHPLLQPSPTVIGKNIIEIAKENSSTRSAFKLSHPAKKYGGLSVFFGNLAREGALLRAAGLKEDWLSYTGTAKVFDTESQCAEAFHSKKIKKGDILILRYCGPKGFPGMPYLANLKKIIQKSGLEESIAIVTDGRILLPGKTPAFVHLTPEAAVGSPLSVIQNGDQISWNYADRSLNVRLTDTEIKVRLSRWKEQEKNMKNSFLYRYSKYSSSSSLGATLI